MPADSIYVRPDLRDRKVLGSRAPYPKDRMRRVQDDIDRLSTSLEEHLTLFPSSADYQRQMHKRWLKQKEAALRVLAFDQRLQDREIIVPADRLLDARIHALVDAPIKSSGERMCEFSTSGFFGKYVADFMASIGVYQFTGDDVIGRYNYDAKSICTAALESLGLPTDVYVEHLVVGDNA